MLQNFFLNKKKSPYNDVRRFLSILSCYYSAEGADTGQVSAQAPQSMQVAASITYLPSPSEIAFTGQPSAQAPQLMQSSEILYAIGKHLRN